MMHDTSSFACFIIARIKLHFETFSFRSFLQYPVQYNIVSFPVVSVGCPFNRVDPRGPLFEDDASFCTFHSFPGEIWQVHFFGQA